MTADRRRTGEFVLLDEICQHKYAKKYSGKHRATGIKVLVKDFEVQTDSQQQKTKQGIRALVYREVNILKEANSKFVMKLLDVEDLNDHVYVIQEGMENGTILDIIEKCGELPAKEQQRIIAQLVVGLENLHQELRICHRNISAESIYLDTYYNIRFADFTHAVNLINDSQPMTSVCGLQEFRAPEMLTKQGSPYTRSVDVWSLGSLIYYIVEGRYPFTGLNDHEIRSQIRSNDPKFSRRLSKDLVSLLTQMLEKDPALRIRSEQLRHHPYFAGVDFAELSRPLDPFTDTDITAFLASRNAEVTPAAREIAKAFLATEAMQELGSRVPYVERPTSISRAVSMQVFDSEWKRKAIANGIARGQGKFLSRKSGNWTDASSDLSSDSFLVTKSDGNF